MNSLSILEQKRLEKEKLDEEIVALEKKVEQEKLPEEYQLAILIHDKMCHMSHMDMCGWDYEKWGASPLGATKARYLEKAERILRKVQYHLAVEVIKYL